MPLTDPYMLWLNSTEEDSNPGIPKRANMRSSEMIVVGRNPHGYTYAHFSLWVGGRY
jgi:hypothetical protein